MAWVLWDILIPLAASFALGIVLGWLIWSWRGKQHDSAEPVNVSSNDVEADSSVTDSGLSISDEQVTQFEAENTMQLDASSAKHIESANIVLIRERDEANQALEILRDESDAMQARIAELESSAEHAIPAVTEGDDTSPELTSLPARFTLNEDESKKESEEFLRSDLQQLSQTLEQERKSRRATELELLNIKNRYEKLENELTTTVSADDHTKALEEYDEEIESLKQQLSYQTEQHDKYKEVTEATVQELESSEVSGLRTTETVAIVEPVIESSDEPEPEPEITVENATESIDQVESVVTVAQQQTPAKNGHVPKSWKVPRKLPSVKERDKLTDIKGVGPVLEKMLHDCGIYCFHQVADLNESGMEELQSQIPQFPGRIKRDKWVQQAKKLQHKKYGELA